MGQYSPNLPPGPWHHPCWRPDPALGTESWVTVQDPGVSPIALSPEFSMLALLTDLWVPDDDSGPRSSCPLECQDCDVKFISVGAMIQHFREKMCSGRHEMDGLSQAGT
ncbi:hypothetical protein BKA56DRAFT_585031 [Ilyonectria sp. MPI-CAGE-AT-0026]|nr:hypothetical protein BKA56DRAFT_585031 [Ilyonectria sp. MPI-CAGE-AT-0026]